MISKTTIVQGTIVSSKATIEQVLEELFVHIQPIILNLTPPSPS